MHGIGAVLASEMEQLLDLSGFLKFASYPALDASQTDTLGVERRQPLGRRMGRFPEIRK